jgi:hypothetical protein
MTNFKNRPKFSMNTLNLGPDEVDNLVYYFSKLLLRFGDEWNEMVMLVVRL